VLQHPGDDLLERRPHRLVLAGDALLERDPAGVERLVDLAVDLPVTERLGDPVEKVGLGDGAVEVDDEALRNGS
jgi:hypothetical protein